MKKGILITLLVLFTTLLYARPVYIYEKEGGKFNLWGLYIGFDTVRQTVTYTSDGVGNPIEQYTITCLGKGVNRCKKSGANGIVQMDNDNSFNRRFIETQLDVLNEQIDDIIVNNRILSGTKTRKVSAVSLEGNTCLLFFNAKWDMQSEGTGRVIIDVDLIHI